MKNTIKKAISVLLIAVMVFGAAPLAGFVGLELPEINLFGMKVNAEEAPTSGTCGDNLTWELDTETGELVISGTGFMYGFSYLNAPWDCLSIKTVTISEGATRIGDYAFSGCVNLISVTLPNSVTSIADFSFFGCSSLANITIPDSVAYIGYFAFSDCTSLTSVTIPNSVTSISYNAFSGCDNLTNIMVDSANPTYSSDEYGVLFNKDKTILIKYPMGNTRTSYIISDSVTSIGDWAFECCTNLTSVTIGNRVVNIGRYAFISCTNLASTIIPNRVTNIDDYAFYVCDNLTDVYYTGTEKEWNTMSIGLDNETLTNATIHYNHTHNSESYVVYYDANGGENAPESQVKEAGTDLVLSSKMPCKSYVLSFNANGGNVAPTSIELDATFRGWCLDPNGIGILYAPGSVYKENSTITLYAIWDYPEIGTLPVPERSGYTFKGWFAASGTRPVEEGCLLMADVTLYAQWIVNEPNTPDDSPVPSEPVNRDVIIYPTQTTISYGDSIILHMDASKIPQGGKVEWYANNGNFSYSVIGNGYSCIITPDKNGDTTFTATIYDAKGNAVSTDEQTMTSKAGFFDKIIAFFKKLFGATKVIPQAFKGIY